MTRGDISDHLRELGRLASELGPALVPSGHDELLKSITSAAQQLFGAAACSLALLDQAQEHLVFTVASGAGEQDVVGLQLPVGQGIAGWVVSSGQPIAIADVGRDPRFARDVADSTGYVPRSIMAMPLETPREVLGVISVLDRRASEEGTRDMELLAVFARQAALAIEHARAFTMLGRVLLLAAGSMTPDDDLGAALRRVAAEDSGPSAEMADLAASLHELSMAGPAERQAATQTLSVLASYARRRHH